MTHGVQMLAILNNNFIFRLFTFLLFLVNLNLILRFPSHIKFIIIVIDKVLISSSPVSSYYFFCLLPNNQSRDVTPRLGVSVILQCNFHSLQCNFHSLQCNFHLRFGCYYYDYVLFRCTDC